jgi:LmbE family N-acetylglucosaminyl deacetylase
LVVAAHPDDEVLGCGGTLARLAAAGIPARSCILVGDAEVRAHRPDLPELRQDTHRAQEILGIAPPVLGCFPNIRLNTVPHVELVQFIEAAIEATQANLIFTHHPGDLNDDHLQTSRACQAAARLFQRRPDLPRLKGLYFMEVPSATDWALSPGPAFRADTFVELGTEALDCKIRALQSYQGVMRNYPHPRSEEVLRGLAACRGAQAGMDHAEAFEVAFAALSF